jgi:opacity protein-like surface antigen
LNLGAAWNHAEFSDVNNGGLQFAFFGVPQPFWTVDKAGFTIGGQAGYNLQAGNFVYGIEGDLNWADAKASGTFVPNITIKATTKLESMDSIRGRLGVAFGPVLIYGTGGVAFAHFSDAWGLASTGGNTFSDGTTRTAGIFGGGIEYMFAPNWIARVEALYANFGTSTITVLNPAGLIGPYVSSFEHKVTTARRAQFQVVSPSDGFVIPRLGSLFYPRKSLMSAFWPKADLRPAPIYVRFRGEERTSK